MIQLKIHKDGTTGLVAVCDACQKTVMAAEANLLWTPGTTDEPTDCMKYRIACKGKCTHFFDAQFGHQWSQDLDTAIGYLINNTKTNLKSARRKMELLAWL
jgi:hypothetical protein